MNSETDFVLFQQLKGKTFVHEELLLSYRDINTMIDLKKTQLKFDAISPNLSKLLITNNTQGFRIYFVFEHYIRVIISYYMCITNNWPNEVINKLH